MNKSRRSFFSKLAALPLAVLVPAPARSAAPFTSMSGAELHAAVASLDADFLMRLDADFAKRSSIHIEIDGREMARAIVESGELVRAIARQPATLIY